MPGARLKSLTPDEAGLQRVIVEGLTALGFVVLITSRRPKRCPHCRRWGHSGAGDGVSRGLPDLLVWHPAWRGRGFVGLECKSPSGRVRPEQQALADAGAIVIVRSWEDALAAVGYAPEGTRADEA